MTAPARSNGVTEAQWQHVVTDLAKLLGWRTWHNTVAWRSDPGWPDLVLVRDRVVFAELKVERGKLTAAQEIWLLWLRAAGADVHVWRPSDIDAVRECLR